MPRQTEPNANNALGDLLRGMMPGCEIRSENTQTFVDHAGRHADVLIAAPGRSPVVVEAEYEPAGEVEKDASERLGLRVQGEPRTVEAAIAVRYPQAVGEAYDVREALAGCRLAYYVLYQDGSRFPESGWLDGSVPDLADLVRLVSVPQKAVEQVANTLEYGIGQAANQLEEMAKLRPNITPVIARLLGMSDVPQTRRMACAIVANAMVFHQRIAGMHEGVKPLRLVSGPEVANPQGDTLSAWTDILKINYWPIFAIAKDILEQIPGDTAAAMLRDFLETAQGVEATGIDNAHDLTGRIFQHLIADRKYLATFYTLPASAALLARLAVSKLEGVDWSDADAIGKLRIGNFACSTATGSGVSVLKIGAYLPANAGFQPFQKSWLHAVGKPSEGSWKRAPSHFILRIPIGVYGIGKMPSGNSPRYILIIASLFVSGHKPSSINAESATPSPAFWTPV